MRRKIFWYRKPYSWLLMLLCLCSGVAAHGQSTGTDSLEALLQSPIDTIRQDALLHLGQRLRHTDPDRSMELLETCYAESETLGLYNRQQKAATSMGITYGMRGDFTAAVQQFNRALDIAIAIGNKGAEASNYTNIGIVYKSLGDYPTSLEYYTKAMQLNHDAGDSSGLASCYSNLGILYDLLGDVEQSMHYYEQSRLIAKAIGEEKVSLLLNIALLKIKVGDYDEALLMLEDYLRLNQGPGKEAYQAMALLNISQCHIEMKQFELGERFARAALDVARRLEDKVRICNALSSLCKSLLGQEKYYEALTAARESFDLATQTESLNLMSVGRQLLMNAYAGLNDYRAAFQQQTEYLALQDSIFNQDKADALQRWEAQLGLKEKEQQLLAQKLQLELLETKVKADQRWKLILGLVALLLGTVAFFLLRQSRLRKRGNELLRTKNQQIERQNEEIEEMNKELEKRMLRAQINPHFIFNSLSSIQHFITSDDRRAALRYLSKFSNLLRQVLESSININVVLAEEIKLLHTYLELEALRFDQDFEFDIETDPDLDIYATEVPVLLVQPFIENAIIHGLLPKQGDRKLSVAFEAHPEFTLCRVVDNGVGRAAGAPKKSGRPSRGIAVTRRRLETLQPGKPHFSVLEIQDLHDAEGAPAGTEVIIRIPK